MRVTIDLDDALIAEIMEITGLSNTEAAVEMALREFIRIHRKLRDVGREGNLNGIRDSWRTDES
ncbi:MULTISPECIES: type II toxin-antitoxin system VapB family antitoxin [Rhizobium/Agrobacterium group]|uniref:Type II toxin-antitoxin system VapB family antitoxin n=2 Tax=Rhizobium/Agrobacterium group TaxID=227290 RepID=A0A546XP29_RHIRH|nr:MULTISPECIES: type II toxin-antitoxin system VapB family antitoxin [Rhizobium/Agrobacterium group]MCZ7467936.1 type II toxin-antitoxin system VapB family antitoxin [Rhizobium rhizogenes]MCZ7479060.1 type II toxin-antitoxin system VapB family antitoxin [Rhizobium rhizogenes]MDO3441361.1 type II toxin-antitoxin system VapB family antitoxin [Agrobacterium sp. V1]TRB02487.1 type II toxin-antitoxin system VapB family antitoxin [Rhizobium rhizogenes]WHO08906.1 type II toxin-antitoxin system VapB 